MRLVKIMTYDLLFKNYLKQETLLLNYGFIKDKNSFIYENKIKNNKFLVKVDISKKVKVDVIDLALNDIYMPFYQTNNGAFTSEIAKSVKDLLIDIRNKCFIKDVFKSNLAKEIISYVKSTYEDEPEYLWEYFPNNAVFRNSKNEKWYLAILTAKGKNFNREGDIELIDLKADTLNIEKIVDNKKFYPAYHMNKKHWFTIILDGSVSFKEICKYIDKSYEIVDNIK